MNRCIVFDLDGTLADTLKDIANSVNRTRQDYGLDELPLEIVVGYTGDGPMKLLQRAFVNHPIDWDKGLIEMNNHYADHPADQTTLYPDVTEGLAALKAAGWHLAVVTNKSGRVARKILSILKISNYFDDIIGNGDGFALKPDPEVMLHLMKKYDAKPENSWILGDNHTDMNSASNAGMNGAFATWGYGFLAEAKYTIKVDSFAEFTQKML